MALKKAQTAARRKKAKSRSGTGSGGYTVKGVKATAKQRDTIDGVLTQCKDDNASRRVMIAAVMTITQESSAGENETKTGNDDLGIYQQGRNWVSVSDAKKPGPSTHAFLITGPTSWKKVHGGVKKAPGNLEDAIKRVQISVGGYAQWEKEATKTVDTWLGNGSPDGGGTDYIKQYSFTRGEAGGSRENTWDATARLVEEVNAYRWAAANTFYAVSGDELRAAAPVLTIDGDEGWIQQPPSWSWSANRAISEMTMSVFAERWALLPGACVLFGRNYGAMSGKWLVFNVSGDSLDDPVTTIVFRRPTKLKAEPASETGSRSESGSSSDLQDICKRISDERATYVYGGGHGVALSKLKSSSHLDCSSSVSLALFRADMMEGRKQAIVSGEFAKSWGRSGKGDDFTVWANDTHVWMEGYDSDGKPAWRFDTSQHGGKSGPAYLTEARDDQSRFKPRHFPGH